MSQDIYWSDYDIAETLAKLTAQNAKDQVHVTVERTGQAQYDIELTCNDHGRQGVVQAVAEVLDNERVRLRVRSHRQRNRQLATVLVPLALGGGALAASANGSLWPLAGVVGVLVMGSSLVERLARPQSMAHGLLLEAIYRAEKPKQKRRRVKKRQWGKE